MNIQDLPDDALANVSVTSTHTPTGTFSGFLVHPPYSSLQKRFSDLSTFHAHHEDTSHIEKVDIYTIISQLNVMLSQNYYVDGHSTCER